MSRLQRAIVIACLPLTCSAQPQDQARIRKACSQCHLFPEPAILPKKAWLGMLNLMLDLANPSQLNRSLGDVRFDELVNYFTARAPDDLDARPWATTAAPSATATIGHVASLGDSVQPGTSHLRMVRLWEDVPGRQLVVADMMSGWIQWADPANWKAGLQKIARLAHPSHVEAVDLDRDGRMDLLVADMGTPVATDQKAGSVVWLRRTGRRTFEKIPLATRLGRVTDVQAADFNGDGKLDLVAADFGRYTAGQVLYLENRSTAGKPLFAQVPLAKAPGAITVPIVDIDGDGHPDFAALMAQAQESVVGYIGNGKGQFRSHLLWAAPHPAWGFSGMAPADVNADGKMDFVVTHGDTVDDGVHFKPYQGVGWIKNLGNLKFEYRSIGPYFGAYAPKVADLDGDGDLDVVAASFLPGSDLRSQRKMTVPGIVWFEQTSSGTFLAHPFADDTCDHAALEVGAGEDGAIEIIAGRMWIRPGLSGGGQSGSADIWRLQRTGAAAGTTK